MHPILPVFFVEEFTLKKYIKAEFTCARYLLLYSQMLSFSTQIYIRHVLTNFDWIKQVKISSMINSAGENIKRKKVHVNFIRKIYSYKNGFVNSTWKKINILKRSWLYDATVLFATQRVKYLEVTKCSYPELSYQTTIVNLVVSYQLLSLQYFGFN